MLGTNTCFDRLQGSVADIEREGILWQTLGLRPLQFHQERVLEDLWRDGDLQEGTSHQAHTGICWMAR